MLKLEIALIICALLLVLVSVYILWFKKNKQTSSLDLDNKFYNFSQNHIDQDVQAVLTINYIDFDFSYKKKKNKEVKAAINFIRDSLIIMKSSKYGDIVQSRFNEIIAKLNTLLDLTTLSIMQVKEIERELQYYKSELQR